MVGTATSARAESSCTIIVVIPLKENILKNKTHRKDSKDSILMDLVTYLKQKSYQRKQMNKLLSKDTTYTFLVELFQAYSDDDKILEITTKDGTVIRYYSTDNPKAARGAIAPVIGSTPQQGYVIYGEHKDPRFDGQGEY